ncbi:MAG TPA: histidine kinase [Anaerolineales bacterium]|nr:histidine kinase [Anaerolineales bacterium]
MQESPKPRPDPFYRRILDVPVRVKVIGIGLLPILILGFSLNYWITTGLSDWLSYILTDVRVQAAMSAGARSVFLVTVLGTIVSILFSLLLSYILTEPLLTLREMTQQVASGNLNARAKIWTKDEIGELAIAINTMTDHLVSNQEAMARRNRSLDAINQVALAANRPDDIHDVLYEILGHIVKIMRLKTGWIFLRDPERKTFHLASWYGIEEEMIPVFLSILTSSPCDCQDNLVDGTLSASAEIRLCGRLEKLTRLNIPRKHVTIPLVAREQQFGVVNLLCEEDVLIPNDDLELLSSIGAQISEIVANAWLQIKLIEKETARQVLLESLVQAQEEERSRLARELHDGAGQTLTSLLVRLKAMEKKSPPQELQVELVNMQGIVSETIEQVRELAYHLRPVVLDEFGLPRALEALAQEMTKGADIAVTTMFDVQDFKIPSEIEVVLYRVAQEGLTNILRHSKATQVRLSLSIENTNLKMSMEDDGVGFDPARNYPRDNQRHLGLISMRERAEILGGSLEVYTAPGQGTTVDVSIPLHR